MKSLLILFAFTTISCGEIPKQPKPKLPEENPGRQVKYNPVQTQNPRRPQEIVEEWLIENGRQSPLFPPMRNEEIKKKLNNFLKGGLAGKGAVFVAAANKYKVDPFLMAAISTHETGYGKSANLKEKNNPAGLMEGGKYFLSYKTLDDGIYAFAARLRERYYNCGLDTIEKIQPKYAPAKNCENDPTGLNANWAGGVRKFYNLIAG